MPASFEQLETQKAQLAEAVLAMTPEQSSFRPSASFWTAVQIVDHLAKTEAAISEQVRGNLDVRHSIGLRDRLGTMFIQRVFASDRQVKTPPRPRRSSPTPTRT